MYKIPRGDIQRPKGGDIFRIRTATEEELEHIAPQREDVEGIPAKNPFEGPYWAFVKGGNINERVWVEADAVRGSYIECHAIVTDGKAEGFIYRPGEKTNKAIRGNDRSEEIEWEGTPQSRVESEYSEVMNEGDIRGDKNDLLNGHL